MSLVVEAPAVSTGRAGLLWLTWRQHRSTLIGALILAAILIGWMTYLSLQLTDLWRQCGETYCVDNSPQGDRLAGSSPLVLTLGVVSRLVQYMPLLVGVFVGVPVLSREHEQRTLLLAWSQDVSPTRWLWTKLGLLGLFVAVVTAAVAGVADHLERMQKEVARGTLFDHLPFVNTGMLPVAASVCWFAVGVTAGALLKRTLPAVFGVVAAFVGVTFLVQWRYPTLLAPLSRAVPMGGPDTGPLPDNTLVVKGGVIEYGGARPSGAFDAAGRQLTGAELERLCPPANGNDNGTALACFADNQLQQHLLYQPGSRIPVFHLLVATGYVGLAAAAVVAGWLIVRRTNLSAG